MTRPPSAVETAVATCVFAVCRGDARPPLDGLPGHRDAVGRVRLVAAGPLAAVVQDLPAADYAEAALRDRLGDRAFVERCATDHHRVVAAVAGACPVVPLPLATLYQGEERARQAVAREAPRFLAALDRVAGRAEWGVKVLSTGAARPAEEPTGAPLTGRAYLDRIRGLQQDREERRNAAAEAAERVDAALRPIAAAARRLRPHEPAPGQPHRQLLNATYLVDHDRAGELAAAVAALRADPDLADRVTVELTGPWAPYSFAGLDEGGER
ncbi:GvpL/GvpF family gas vesicle protein [Streptomyces sp. NPDC127098]|uniref:GvpL/GvpF family gas vesicle protein n=1 Tax=Streptomyces sp. NPDC127098 TaxID=3347137 RepID=UPI00365B1E17